MIRAGLARRVLAGGVDGLCRLTYYGFKSLQLLDPAGARPLDRERRGMSVAEGAAFLLLEPFKTDQPETGLLGAGLSCDAYHPARPHPEGKGALAAMRAALDDAGVDGGCIDYINLHGTGTIDNDLAEARALGRLFGEKLPPLSSVKGAMGHSLAAAGAVEAVIAKLCIDHGILPGSTGCREPDKALGLAPLLEPRQQPVETVLSNSFGFGGNNAALVIGKTVSDEPAVASFCPPQMQLAGWSALTGAGDLAATLAAVAENRTCRDRLDIKTIGRDLPPSQIRRLKRLSIMALSLADRAGRQPGGDQTPGSIFFGTGLGCLSETHDFLGRLFTSRERFASPTDFVGSVHNAAAGQIALHFKATGPNITVSGGDYSFEQALFTAALLGRDNAPALVLAADEGHDRLSALLDPSVDRDAPLADGGGALWLSPRTTGNGPVITLRFFKSAFNAKTLADLVDTLEQQQPPQRRYALIMAGLPAGMRPAAQQQLTAFLSQAGFNGPVVDYRSLTGEFQSASAVAAAMAAEYVHRGALPANLCTGYSSQTGPRGILILGLGKWLTAMEVMPG
jgi:3-oxoacyl-(acyl-carrier-protein) synthase